MVKEGVMAPKGACVVLCCVVLCRNVTAKVEKSRMSVMEPKGVDGVREGNKQKKKEKEKRKVKSRPSSNGRR